MTLIESMIAQLIASFIVMVGILFIVDIQVITSKQVKWYHTIDSVNIILEYAKHKYQEGWILDDGLIEGCRWQKGGDSIRMFSVINNEKTAIMLKLNDDSAQSFVLGVSNLRCYQVSSHDMCVSMHTTSPERHDWERCVKK